MLVGWLMALPTRTWTGLGVVSHAVNPASAPACWAGIKDRAP